MSAGSPALNRHMYEKPGLLITGANGFIGQHLVTAFANRGHRVVAAGRRPMMFGPSVKQELIKDLAEGVDWMPLLQGIDVVIHLALRKETARIKKSAPANVRVRTPWTQHLNPGNAA